jgi:hypothetical protein
MKLNSTDIILKFHNVTMSVIINTQTNGSIESVGMYMISLHIHFHLYSSNGSLFITIKSKGIYKISVVARLFYIKKRF